MYEPEYRVTYLSSAQIRLGLETGTGSKCVVLGKRDTKFHGGENVVSFHRIKTI